jgi:NAD(P)-dependent dehydrogenase (short-subunit alcohol dehydrogenase family)
MKIAIVTGGSRGLGKSMALSLAARGVGVILTYNTNLEEAEAVTAEIGKIGPKAASAQLNVADSSTFAAFAVQIKDILHGVWGIDKFDFLVNNGGVGVNAPFAETTEEQFDLMVNIHLKGVFFLTQKLLPLINEGGRIINISSGLTRFSFPGYSAYASVKGAGEVLTRYLAEELGGRKIAVNTIAPGAIETDFGGGFVRDNEQVNKMIASQTALGRVGLPDDIGGVVASMLSDDTAWINGQRIEVSGGFRL